MFDTPLTREQAVERIKSSEAEIRFLGVQRLAIFGSVARDEARRQRHRYSVQFLPGAKSYDRFLALTELLEMRLCRRLELETTEALSPLLGPRIAAESQNVLRAS